MAMLVSWLTATTRTGTAARSWRTMFECRNAWIVATAGSSPAALATRANRREWSDFRHGSPLGLTINGAIEGRLAAETAKRFARTGGIGTGRCVRLFLPRPFRELGIISRGSERLAWRSWTSNRESWPTRAPVTAAI